MAQPVSGVEPSHKRSLTRRSPGPWGDGPGPRESRCVLRGGRGGLAVGADELADLVAVVLAGLAGLAEQLLGLRGEAVLHLVERLLDPILELVGGGVDLLAEGLEALLDELQAVLHVLAELVEAALGLAEAGLDALLELLALDLGLLEGQDEQADPDVGGVADGGAHICHWISSDSGEAGGGIPREPLYPECITVASSREN